MPLQVGASSLEGTGWKPDCELATSTPENLEVTEEEVGWSKKFHRTWCTPRAGGPQALLLLHLYFWEPLDMWIWAVDVRIGGQPLSNVTHSLVCKPLHTLGKARDSLSTMITSPHQVEVILLLHGLFP